MPVIGNPRRIVSYGPPSSQAHDQRETSRSARIGVRIRTARRRATLTRELAAGAAPGASPELALRAAQLTSSRSRRTLARTLRRTITDARSPMMTRSRVVIIRRGAVLEAESAINRLITRLASPAMIQAKGMAIADEMLSNANGSPLYNQAEAGALQRLVRAATAALEPSRATSHEFPITA